MTKTYKIGTVEREWLKAAVRSAKAAGKWTIIGMHHPCFSLGEHGCADTSPAVTDLAMGLGVDVVAGHDHNYQRTNQLPGTTADTEVVDQDNAYKQQSELTKGSVFVGVGNAGHKPRTTKALTPLWEITNGTNSPGDIASGYGEVVATATTLTYRYVPSSGLTLTDGFTITR